MLLFSSNFALIDGVRTRVSESEQEAEEAAMHAGRGYSTKFPRGKLRPGVQPITLLYIILTEMARIPFCISLTEKRHFFRMLS